MDKKYFWMSDEDETRIKVWDRLVKDIFKVDIPERIERIFVDLDSCLSILTSEPLPNDNGVKNIIIKNTIVSIANFLELYKNFAYIHVYYSFKPTKIFNDYIPEWNIERNERLKEDIIKVFQQEVIRRLKKINLENIDLTECDDTTIIDIDKALSGLPNHDDVLIISRDHHYQCLFSKFPRMSLFDGRHMLTNKDLRLLEKYPMVHYLLVPYYYILVGLHRHGYKGVHGFGKMKAKKYLEINKERIISGEDELFKTLMNQEKVLLMKF